MSKVQLKVLLGMGRSASINIFYLQSMIVREVLAAVCVAPLPRPRPPPLPLPLPLPLPRPSPVPLVDVLAVPPRPRFPTE